MFVFSPSGEQELTISAPQISAHTVSMLSLLSSHTPVNIQQYAVTTLCAVKHTHTTAPAATFVYPSSPDESLSTPFDSVLLQGGKGRVCRLCVSFSFLSAVIQQ